ncbi:uncharacterized protein LODBEIA_P58730 [Lodderomyces beijingensis]|uniref:MADS-box domain-containing protein n=1 Tax=Lodderomyces beijingensis TaxID=1775926 RepID=A0ABP0ZU29_9ASCO
MPSLWRNMSAKLEDPQDYDGSNNGNPMSASLSNPPVDDDDDDDGNSSGKTQKERRKIEIKFIQDKSRRHITFSKRKAGIMKKAYELSVLTGTQVLLLVVSETGLVYTFTTPKLQPLVTKPEGKNLIQACLNAPEEGLGDDQGDQSDGEQAESPEPSPVPPPQQQQQAQAQAQVQQQHAHLQQQHQQAAAAAHAAHHQAQAQAQQQPGQQMPPQGMPHYQTQPGPPQNPGQQQQQQPGQSGQPGQPGMPYGDYYFGNMQNSNIPNQQQFQ